MLRRACLGAFEEEQEEERPLIYSRCASFNVKSNTRCAAFNVNAFTPCSLDVKCCARST